MKITSSYIIRIKNADKIFSQTIRIYRSAIKFCVNAFEQEWDFLKDIDNSKYQAAAARSLIHSAKSTTDNSEPADKKISLLSEMRAKVPGFQKRTQNTLKTLTAIHEYLAACA